MNQSTQVVRAAVLAIMLVLTGGLLTSTRAQTQTCRDVNQIKICGDAIDEFPATANGGGFRLRGNVRIGPKNGAALVEVEDIGSVFDGTVLDQSITTASYFHFNQADPNTGSTDFIIGDIRMINDVTGLTLLGTSVFDIPGPDVRVGRLFVDTNAGRIFNPAANAVPIFVTDGVPRNGNVRLAFMTQVGAQVFFKEGGTVEELSKVDAEFNIFTREFKGTIPVNLKLSDTSEKPVQITIVSTFSETGVQNSTVNGFKFGLGGLVMDVAGAKITPPSGNNPAEFVAATVKVLKGDNAGVPTLEKSADPNLIFALSNVKYKNGAWSLSAVEVGIKPWEVGPAFKMNNQTIGIINESNSTVQAFQIKSTLEFGTGGDISKLPVTIKIGRTLVDGVAKPLFQGGLGNISPKLGALTFKLTGANFVSDAAQDFLGITAQSVAVQWPPHLGGKTAAAINNFKLGTNVARKFIFQIGSGTLALPELENNLFKGTLSATIGMVQETLTVTGTGTLNVKLPGNGNTAGVITTLIMRYNKDAESESSALARARAAVDASGNALPDATPYEYQPMAGTAITKCIAVFGQQTNCPDTPPPPPPPFDTFELKLTGFSMKVAGFGLTINNPKGTDDGGFTTDLAALSLPVGMLSSGSSSGIQVQGFGISGNGNVSIQGGGFELAPISVGSVQFVGLKGTFLKKPDNSYEFTAAGKLPLPGIEPGTNSGGIGVSITVKLAASGNFNGVGVIVEFGSPPLPPIPIGNSGMNLTKVTGSFDLTNQTVTIGLGLTATSKFKLPIGAASIPLATANGNVTTQFNPFKFTGNVSLSVLIFQVATATVKIGPGEGFSGGDGMNVSATVDAVIVSGQFNMRVGKGVPSNPEKRRFAASATWILGIPANKYGVGRPPFNLGGIQVGLAGGIFTDNNKNPAGEATGVKGNICGPNGNLCVGFFINLGANMGGGDFLDFTNIEKYVLIPAAALRAAAAAGEVGYVSRAMTPQEAQTMGLVLASSQINGTEGILQETINIEVTSTTTLVAGINYLSGTPSISLKLPDDTILTEGSVNGTTQTFLETEAISDTTNLLFTISGATPGTYQLIINNAPAEYELVSYVLNSPPTATLDDVDCGGPDVPGLTVECHDPIILASAEQADTPMVVNETNATIEWTTADVDSPDAEVGVGYVVDPGAPELVDYANINFVAEGLPVGPGGSHVIDFTEVGTGSYRPVVVIDDHQNGIIIATTGTTITVVDLLPPAIPAGLTAVSQAGELLIKWDQNSERDLAGYDIGFALVDDTSQFIYTRTMGPKEIVTGTNNIVDAKLWGLTDDTTVFYGLRAFDTSGNYSDWTPLQSAKPWALSPNTWNPVPNGEGEGAVEIAFDVPMVATSIDDELSVKGADGSVLPGEAYFLLNATGDKIVGVGFEPSVPYSGTATATLVGGVDGAKAEDGRTMGGNYTWSFAWQFTPPPDFQGIYMPMLFREDE